MYNILAIIAVVMIAIILISLLASVVGFLFQIAVIVIAAAIIYRIYLDYKTKR